MSFNAKDMTQGGQIASMRIRMFSQIANIILYCLFIFFWILVGLVLWVKISWQTFVNGCIYWWCTTLEGMRDLIRSQPVYEIQYYGKTFRMNAAQVLHDKYMIWCGEQLWSAFVLASVVALVICLITFFVVSWILGRQGKQQSENEITGGRQLTDNPKEVARMLKKDGKDSDIRIGDLPIIRDSEIQNFCLHGTVGAGKSEVIRRLANYARQRGDMVVIYDRSGEFVKSYYDPSIDKILNPLDARCAAWDLWKECLTQPDFDNTANTLIPMGTKEDPFWQGSGRTIFAEAAYLMRNDPNRSYSKLVDTLLSIKIEKLRTFLRNSPAANLVEEKIEKTAISIRAVLTNYVKAIRYLQGIEHNGEPFTIRDWMRGVREDQKNGWLFISSNADTHASLKPVISMWLSIAIRGLLAMGENRNRRVWFFCDELPTLHKLPDLVEILPEARKFGGCYVFGIQSYAQLEDIYGEKAAATLFDVMNTRAFFRSPSHKIAEFAAGEIGEKEHLKASEQYSYGADPVRDGVSTGNLVMALFNHDTSRDQEPQLHTHAVVANVTQHNGEWKTLSSDKVGKTGFIENVYANQIAFGRLYREKLKEQVEALGYETEVVGKHGMWEMPGVRGFFPDVLCLSSYCAGRSGCVTGMMLALILLINKQHNTGYL
ncbi:TPA: type IV conjugative transfer system coupling protein TraD [Escherichia coli]|nr:type IV conjugative transfer system coupling protein TraD [Escherichia coli]